MGEFTKPLPASIGIFGANNHIGTPMARWLQYNAPSVKLRLISSKQENADNLRKSFPDCEVFVADYFDLPSMIQAVDRMEGLFVSLPYGMAEREPMTNLVKAIRASNSLIHMIRTVGLFPRINPRLIPDELTKSGTGLETQNPIGMRILEDADMPVTFFNLGATFMDNFVKPLPMLSPGKLTWSNRRVPFIDPREIGEAAARILLSDNARHLRQFHTLNNNQDLLSMSEAAEIMSEVLMIDIAFDGSRDAFMSGFARLVDLGAVPAAFPENLWNFLAFEDANDVIWALNDFLERTLGRKPNTLRSWVAEHRDALLLRLRP